MAEWWDKNKDFSLKDESFQRVLDFFLFHCPSEIEKVNKRKGTRTYSIVLDRMSTFSTYAFIKGGISKDRTNTV